MKVPDFHKSRILIMLTSSVLAIALLSNWTRHEFYVSLTEIRYNGNNSHFEISMRIFPDDLDKALESRYGIRTHLATELEHPGADSLLRVYIQLHFQLHSDGIGIPLEYLGKEPEANALWCYLESAAVKEPSVIFVKNSLLTDAFLDQVNIVQVYVGDWNQGLLLDGDRSEGRYSVGK